MNIGLLFCCYGSPQYVQPCLENWLKLKDKYNLKIAAVHGQFKEYQDLKILDEDFETQKQLKKLYKKKDIDFLYLQNDYDDKETAPIYENEAQIRDKSLQWLLTQNVDWVCLLDLDEFATEEQIDSIIKFLQSPQAKSYAWIKQHYRNYILDGKQWLDNFSPPRYFQTNFREFRLNSFYHDNDVLYTENLTNRKFDYKQLPNTEIPKSIQIRHESWVDNEKTRMKIRYQENHFGKGNCSYKIGLDGKVCIDYDFFLEKGLPIPVIKKDN